MLIKLVFLALAFSLFLKAFKQVDQEKPKWGPFILMVIWLPLMAIDAKWTHFFAEKWGISFFALVLGALYVFGCAIEKFTEEHKPRLRTFILMALWLPLVAIDAKWTHLLNTGKWSVVFTVTLVLSILLVFFFGGRSGDQGILKLKFWYQRHWALKGNKFLWIFWSPVALAGIVLYVLLKDPILNFIN